MECVSRLSERLAGGSSIPDPDAIRAVPPSEETALIALLLWRAL